MALLAANGKYLTRATNLWNSADMSLTMWVKTNGSTGTRRCSITYGTDLQGSGDFRFMVGTDEAHFYTAMNASLISGDVSTSTPTWYYYALRVSSGSATVSIQQLGDSDSFGGPQTQGGHASPTSFWIGRDKWNNDYSWLGHILALKVWTATLSEAQLTAEKFYYEPQVTSDLHAWYPLITESSDHSANGYDFTEVGSPTYEDQVPAGMNALGGAAGRNPVPMDFGLS